MFRNIPIVTKNLLIINVLAFVASCVLEPMGIKMEDSGGLHFFMASDFRIWQFVTYLFLHGSFTHLFFNMFALWMFGCVIENVWGTKRFIIYYIVCGVFAGVCQELVQTVHFYFVASSQYPMASLGEIITIAHNSGEVLNSWLTIGASGAVYAILLAFGMTFPNERIFIFPLPVPIKAKWFVVIYATIELFYALIPRGDGIAHMAHLGGMLSGFLLILYWRKQASHQFNMNGSRQFFERWGAKYKQTTQRTNQPENQNHAKTSDDMEYNARKKVHQEEIDRILDKIRKSGYDSLSKEEKQRLFDASHQR